MIRFTSPARSNLAFSLAFSMAFTFALTVALTFATTAPARAETAGKPQVHEYAMPSKLASKALLLDVVEAGTRLVAVGEFGHVLFSDDDGENWTQSASVPTRNTLTGVIFLDNQTGYAIGHEATILKTIDGGNNWTLQYNERRGEDPLFGIYFADANHGIAVGGFAKVFETSNGGETWTQRTLIEDSFDDFHLNDIFADKRGNVYIPAEFGTVYKSRDRGKTWAAIETGYDGSLWGGMGLADGGVLVHGMRGNAFVTRNGGKSWRQLNTGIDQSVTGGVQLQNGTIVLTGLSGAVLVSTDNTKTFKAISRPDRLNFSTASRGKGETVLLYGTPGIKTQTIK
jgi:photosystem II stability/assembly factor-like uncharacterized protein